LVNLTGRNLPEVLVQPTKLRSDKAN